MFFFGFFHCLVFKLVNNDILDVYSGNGSLGRVRVMMFNATFNNISVISWRSVVLVKETGIPGEKYRPVATHRQTLEHNGVSKSQQLKNYEIIHTDTRYYTL
jgi:hypothetical protein